MLPNHSPLVIAEQFGTLASLFPGRIDLGLGRAPGSDQATARALRRNLAGDADAVPAGRARADALLRATEPGQPVRAVPGAGLEVPIWILGSSLFGAQLAAALGLPFAFASHFAPAHDDAGDRALPRPLQAVGAAGSGPTSCWASTSSRPTPTRRPRFLATSMQQAFVNLRTGRPSSCRRRCEATTQRSRRRAGDARPGALLHRDRLAGDGAASRCRRSSSAPAPTS